MQKSVLEPVGRLNLSSQRGAEIAAYLSQEKKLLIASGDKELLIVNIKNPSKPEYEGKKEFPEDIPSVAVYGNLVAVPVMGNPSTAPGTISLFRWNDSLSFIKSYPICAGPDMITFSPTGKQILIACEGTPSEGIDPPGEIALLDISKSLENGMVSILGFGHLDSAKAVSSGVRLSGPGSFIQNLEPEYITVEPSGKIAWVSLQENNAVAQIDLKKKEIIKLIPLGVSDHSLKGYGLDYEKNGKIQIKNAPLLGIRGPDGIAVLQKGGRYFLFTANEGASRKFDGLSDETKIQKIMEQKKLDPQIFTSSVIQSLDKMTLSSVEICDTTQEGLCRALYSFGSRSMSVFDGISGKLLFDSGDQIEQMLAKTYPQHFNQNGKKGNGKPDTRSNEKGSEPETVTLGKTGGKDYAFLGLERMGGIVVWDVSNPEKPVLTDYIFEPADRGPEGILFIPENESPLPETALLVVCYEYSKTLVIYKIKSK